MKLVLLALLFVPVAVLLWRVVVSKRRWPIRIGAAAAAMTSVVGALVLYDKLGEFRFGDWREVVALFAAVTSSVYLLVWAARHRGNRRHRTISIIAGIIGLVPFAATAALSAVYRG